MINVNTKKYQTKNNNTDKRSANLIYMEQKSLHYDTLIAKRFGWDFSNRVNLAFGFESPQLQVLRKQVLYNTMLSGITTIEVARQTINDRLTTQYLDIHGEY